MTEIRYSSTHVVRCTTTHGDEGIAYEIHVNGKPEWKRYVAFGRKTANRAAGAAFQDAAREQDRRARIFLSEAP